MAKCKGHVGPEVAPGCHPEQVPNLGSADHGPERQRTPLSDLPPGRVEKGKAGGDSKKRAGDFNGAQQGDKGPG